MLGTVALALPHEAWLPLSHGQATADDWTRVHDGAAAWLGRAQIDGGGRLLPGDAIGGAIAVAALCGAAAAWWQARAMHAAGLPPTLAGLLAMVAALAPLATWQSASPLGAAPVSAASAAALWWLARRSCRVAPQDPAPHPAPDPAGAAHARQRDRTMWRAAVVLTASSVLAPWLWHAGSSAACWSAAGTAARQLVTELGAVGVVLLLPSLARRTSGGLPGRVWLTLTAIWLLSMPVAPHVRVAAMLPWAWWLTGAGLAELLAWRQRGTSRWAAVALAAWAALQVAATPWGHQWQQAALVRGWAEGIAARIDDSHVLVHEASARGLVLATLAREGRLTTDSPPIVVEPRNAYAVAQGGRRVVVTTAAAFEALRWGGLALDRWPEDRGVSIDRLLDFLPDGTVVLAAVSGEAAATLTPLQWQALARAGLRRADGGTGRAHVLAGVTGARVEALEAAQVGSVQLDVQPGDPLGRTGVRSPVDVRLDADATGARIALRGEPIPTGEAAIVVVLLNRRGDVLAWRSGPDAAHLDGSAAGMAVGTRAVSVAALPCVELAAARTADIGPLMGAGAIGISWQAPATVEVSLTRPAGTTGQGVRLAGPATHGAPVLTPSKEPDAFVVDASRSAAAGIYLRGPVTEGRARADGPVRLCAAWPMAEAVDASRRSVDFGMRPEEPHLGFGWHDSEFESGSGFFRWMAGPRAELLVALRTSAPLTLALDAQAPGVPTPSDQVRLLVNGRDLGPRPLLPTRGLYTWAIDAADLRAGVNTLAILTTQTARPADGRPGGDARTLGLLVRGWTVGPATAQPRL